MKSDSRRLKVPFDVEFFGKRGEDGVSHSESRVLEERFREAHSKNLWGAEESRSGGGSVRDQTSGIVEALPVVLRQFGVQTLLDLPCGDFNWMQDVRFEDVEYVGADILPELIERNTHLFSAESRSFVVLNLCEGELPSVDLLFSRDCLVHFSYADINRAIANIRRAGITYLMTTTFPDEPENIDIVSGDWRPLNFELPPFSFPNPEIVLYEGCTEQDGLFSDKSLGVWAVASLPS